MISRLLFLIFASIISLQIFSQNSKSNFFSSDTLIELEFYFNANAVYNDIGFSPRYHDLKIQYCDSQNMRFKIDAEIKTRGIFRKNSDICNFPPLVIKFNESKAESTVFEKLKKVKLVTHCQNNINKYEESILKEYLVYRIFNVLTPYSFRVKLARIKYIDSYKNDTLAKFAFFIEPDEMLARRLNGVLLDRKNIHPNATNKYSATFMSVFQYMIGNTDWSIKALHNIRLIELYPGEPSFTIPYDFDFCGVVNSPYARPAEYLPITSVRDRYFNGYCRPLDYYNDIVSTFQIKKDSIYQLVNNFNYLQVKEKQKIINYFDQFYRIIESPKKREKEFVKKCRTD